MIGLLKKIGKIIGIITALIIAITAVVSLTLDYDEIQPKTNEELIKNLKDKMNHEYLQCNESNFIKIIEDCKTKLKNEFVESVRKLTGKI